MKLKGQYRNKQFPLGNPLANLLVIVVGALAVGASIVLGVVAFITLGGLLLIMAAVIGVRIWWMNWKLRRGFHAGDSAEPRRADVVVEVIEGEFRDVSNRKDNDSK